MRRSHIQRNIYPYTKQSLVSTTLRKKAINEFSGKWENAGNQHFHLFFPNAFCPFCLFRGKSHHVAKHLTLSQTSPGFYVSTVQVFLKLCGKRRNCS